MTAMVPTAYLSGEACLSLQGIVGFPRCLEFQSGGPVCTMRLEAYWPPSHHHLHTSLSGTAGPGRGLG